MVDLDGVMWRGSQPIPGSAEAVADLLARGDRVLFCTNNSTQSGATQARSLVAAGLPEGVEVVTSADATAGLLASSGREEVALVVGGTGLCEALSAAGCRVVPAGEMAPTAGTGAGGAIAIDEVTSVVVGLDRDFDYRRLDVAQAAVAGGARLFATNTDATFPGADRLHPGAGSIVAAVETATGMPAVVAGKPHEPMAEAVRERLGRPDAASTLVVGDRLDTDGALAERLGWPFALVLSGVTATAPSRPEVPVRSVVADLAALVDAMPPT